jgi:hypothetical protein
VLAVGICRGVSYRHGICRVWYRQVSYGIVSLYQSGSVLQAIFKHSQQTRHAEQTGSECIFRSITADIAAERSITTDITVDIADISRYTSQGNRAQGSE